PRASFLWAVAAGTVGGGALAAFYAALAEGKMGIVAPVAAVLTAALPVMLSVAIEGLPRWTQILGFLLAMAALWMVSRPQQSHRPEGLGLALLSGVGFGLFLICIRQAGQSAVLWPLVTSRGMSVISVLLASSVLRKFRAPDVKSVGLCVAAGALDVS